MKRIKNNCGFSLIEVMVVAGVFAVLALGMMNSGSELSRQSYKMHVPIRLLEIRQKVSAILQNRYAWNFTVENVANTNLDCLRSNSDANMGANLDLMAAATCRPFSLGPPGPYSGGCTTLPDTDCGGQTGFALYRADNTLYYDATSATAGFDKFGQPCDTYSATPATDDCPYKVLIDWKPICSGLAATCVNPRIMIRSRLVYSVPATMVDSQAKLNLSKYDFTIVREPTFPYNRIILEAATAPYVHGGNCVPGDWEKVNFTKAVDTGNDVSIAGGDITFQPGTYDCEFSVAGFFTLNFRGHLIDSLGSTITNPYPFGSANNIFIRGSNGYSKPSNGSYPRHVTNRIFGRGRFTLDYPRALSLVRVCEANVPPANDQQAWGMANYVGHINPIGHSKELFTYLTCKKEP